ncbi:MAG: hypothetical protein DRP78_06595 [Candidatus Omnitrophota bacterium]|nr:MAG: hypothetical protein DRP78_06595 [Candidatus Omnitrophota bacterium]
MQIFEKKGTILFSTCVVILVIVGVMIGFFTIVSKENVFIAKQNDRLKAFNFAEKGIAYAYNECYHLAWQWYTHKWNKKKNKLLPLAADDVAYHQTVRPDCKFDAQGFYVADNGEFMVKAYPNPKDSDDTVIVCKGISGLEEKVIVYHLARNRSHQFFYYSPYTLNLFDAVGNYAQVNGGEIHSNGNIVLDNNIKLENISKMSTGKTGSVKYAVEQQYAAPHLADILDGVIDGKAPIQPLDNPLPLYRNGLVVPPDPGPFGRFYSKGPNTRYWTWKTLSYHFSGTPNGYRDQRGAFMNNEWHFSGSKMPEYDLPPGGKVPVSGVVNDSGKTLNWQNFWIKPYKTDKNGNQIATKWIEIPSTLPQTWLWQKYIEMDATDQPVTFYLAKDPAKTDVANTYWIINKANDVEQVSLKAHPEAKSYWDMFKSNEYWTTQPWKAKEKFIGNFNPEMADGKYADDLSLLGGKEKVEHLNSYLQKKEWKKFLKASNLKKILCDGRTGGKNIYPPDFTSSYKTLAKKDGIFIDLVGFDGEFNDYNEWDTLLKKSIQDAVVKLNAGAGGNVAQEKSFINCWTDKRSRVLEIDLAKWKTKGSFPHNGVFYTKVPVRFINAEELPRSKTDYGFTVVGEENIYLKGDYNTQKWTTSSIVCKKRVFTLSDDFNDPQDAPAPQMYPDYPYLYVVKNAAGDYVEADVDNGGGIWVWQQMLDSDGSADDINCYPLISDTQQKKLYDYIDAKQVAYAVWRNGMKGISTFNWPASGESHTFAPPPNKVTKTHTYNCFIASHRWVESDHKNRGNILEDWQKFKRVLNGAYFVIPKDGFTAEKYVDYVKGNGLYYSKKGRRVDTKMYTWIDYINKRAYNEIGLSVYGALTDVIYDSRFLTAGTSPADVFFGGNVNLWGESSPDFFAQTDF